MVTLVVEHGLEDFDAWKRVFDEHGEPRITFWDTVQETEF